MHLAPSIISDLAGERPAPPSLGAPGAEARARWPRRLGRMVRPPVRECEGVHMNETPVLRSLAGGEWIDGRAAPDLNPARPAEAVAEVRLADAAGAERAVQAARAALPDWRATPAPARGEILRR